MIAEVENKLDDIRALCEEYGVEELYLFGSAAFDDYEPGQSDIDFQVKFGEELPEGKFKQHFGFMTALEELLGTRVDLVEMDHVTNPYFRKSAEKYRVKLYAA